MIRRGLTIKGSFQKRLCALCGRKSRGNSIVSLTSKHEVVSEVIDVPQL